jgi:tyrosine-specific transport protein
MSGLLIAELTLNRMAATGRPGVGLLDLYESSLGQPWSKIGSAAYFFLHYAMMVAYIAQGGHNVSAALGWEGTVAGPIAFAAACGLSLFFTRPAVMEKVNNVLVGGVAVTFAGIVALGAGSAQWGALIDPVNQHPEKVVDCFPILFLAFVFQNIVPTIVQQLEGDRNKIIQAIIAGTTVPFLMFLSWNAVVLGNVLGSGYASALTDPVALLQSGTLGAASSALGPLVSAFSSLALVTSIVGFTYGLVNAWTDVFQWPSQGKTFEQIKAALYALVFLPPLGLSLADPDIFYKALEYGGAFGVSTLFLVLPPIMTWKERYGSDNKPLITQPMVPFGKLPLGSMWKAAGTLMVEQTAEKLGVFTYIQEHFLNNHVA